LKNEGLSPERYGVVLFKNYESEDSHLLIRESIISGKTLSQELRKSGLLKEDEKVPAAVEKIYKKSVPKFKTQLHFYGYDGRGNAPSCFDCNYTYNLGMTVFSLVANGATGQMAAIRNLEKDFSQWEPVGIPIAPLMMLEERKGRLSLVIEKSLVNTGSPSFQVMKAMREKWLAADPGPDHYRIPGSIQYSGDSEEKMPISLALNATIRKD
jgi:pyrophosphate--fructose-6-phosphate 1-phosphotransferase